METQISKSKFKAHALEIFRHVETTGEAVIVTDHGAPAVIVRKYTGTTVDVRAKLKGSVLRYDAPFAPVADDAWEALA
jgi:antitoxin (DNA-binding transcriptional repressor) of toxin-antitoxin stability system